MDISIPNFGFVFHDKVAGAAHPGSGARLAGALAELRQGGIASIVSLSESPLERAILREFEFAYAHVPVVDFSAPTVEQMSECVEFIDKRNREGDGVLIHCAAGQGRTGTMLAAFLVARGLGAEEAIEKIRRLRPGSIETRGQESAVHAFDRHLKEGAK
jgi:atypical dual specificity phosphatase